MPTSVNIDWGQIITAFAPVVLQVVMDAKSSGGTPTQDDIVQVLHRHVAIEKAKGTAWAAAHPGV